MPAETTAPKSTRTTTSDSEGSPTRSAIERLLPAPLRWWNWSFAAQVAIVALLLLLLLWGMAVWWQSRNPHLLPWSLSQHWWRPVAVAALTVMIPLLVFLSLDWKQASVRSPDEDLIRDWFLGVEALADRGVTLGDRPLIVVLGSTSPTWEQALFAQSTPGFPSLSPLLELEQRELSLQWYLAPEVIILVAREIGCLGELNARLAPRFHATEEVPGERPVDAPSTVSHPGSFPQFEAIDVNESLPIEVMRRQSDRIALLGELLRGARNPHCGLNGVLTLVPFPAIFDSDRRAEDSGQRAAAHGSVIGNDLRILAANLDLQFPVVCLLTDLQEEPGFLEGMRRTEDALKLEGRFGRRFDLDLLAGHSELQLFARLLRHDLEMFIKSWFDKVDVLKRPGNRDLCRLLGRMRSEIALPLTKLLTTAFSEIPGESPEEIPFHFAGCYFAATGRESDQRCFGPAVLARLLELQDHVQWSKTGLSRSTSHRRLQVVAAISTLLLLGLLVVQLFT